MGYVGHGLVYIVAVHNASKYPSVGANQTVQLKMSNIYDWVIITVK